MTYSNVFFLKWPKKKKKSFSLFLFLLFRCEAACQIWPGICEQLKSLQNSIFGEQDVQRVKKHLWWVAATCTCWHCKFQPRSDPKKEIIINPAHYWDTNFKLRKKQDRNSTLGWMEWHKNDVSVKKEQNCFASVTYFLYPDDIMLDISG